MKTSVLQHFWYFCTHHYCRYLNYRLVKFVLMGTRLDQMRLDQMIQKTRHRRFILVYERISMCSHGVSRILTVESIKEAREERAPYLIAMCMRVCKRREREGSAPSLYSFRVRPFKEREVQI